jgi:hypothetical protein
LASFGASTTTTTILGSSNKQGIIKSKDIKQTVLQVANDLLEKSGIIQSDDQKSRKSSTGVVSIDEENYDQEVQVSEEDESLDEQDLEDIRM